MISGFTASFKRNRVHAFQISFLIIATGLREWPIIDLVGMLANCPDVMPDKRVEIEVRMTSLRLHN